MQNVHNVVAVPSSGGSDHIT